MLDIKRNTPLLAVVGAVALLMTSAPSFAQAPAPDASAPAASAPADASGAAAAPAPAAQSAPTSIKHAGSVTPITMFLDAEWVVKIVMVGLLSRLDRLLDPADR